MRRARAERAVLANPHRLLLFKGGAAKPKLERV